jgi:hypothetical protein
MMPRRLVVALSVASLSVTSAHATPPACQAPIGEAVPLTATSLSVEDMGGRYDTSTGWPAPGEKRVAALRYQWGLMLQSDDPRFAHVDQLFSGLRSAETGCWLSMGFVWGQGGVVTGIDKAQITADPYQSGYVRPQPDHRPPPIAGHRYVAASESYSDAYPSIGLYAVEGDEPRTAIVAFNASEHIVLATLPYRLTNIATLPDPHAIWTGITVSGSGLREPSPYLSLMWRPASVSKVP